MADMFCRLLARLE